MLELRRDELARCLCLVVAADPRLRVPLQFGKGGNDGGSVRLAYPVVSSNQSRERNGLRSGEGRIPPGPVLDCLRRRSVHVRVFLSLTVPH